MAVKITGKETTPVLERYPDPDWGSAVNQCPVDSRANGRGERELVGFDKKGNPKFGPRHIKVPAAGDNTSMQWPAQGGRYEED